MIVPPKLKKGDEIRIIAPAKSLALIPQNSIEYAKERFEQQGFKITFSKNCKEKDILESSSIKSRIEDLHEAFSDNNVKAIFTVLGGFNSNQLLKYIDYELIKNNPKIICGYSDITALTNAITAKTDLITYSGLFFSTWAMKKEFEYNLEYFKKCLFEEDEFIIKPSKTWSDDEWYKNQDIRDIKINEGFWLINKGECEGKIIGGNLCTLNLLQGTEYMPSLKDTILFLEDDYEVDTATFDRDLQSLIHLPDFKYVKGIIIGRFQKKSNVTLEKIKHIIKIKEELKNIPIIANVDFGHTNPIFTFPIGGTAKIKADNEIELKIIKH